MKCGRKSLRLYAVTDRSWLRGSTLEQQVEEALRGGATFVQLREKQLDRQTFRQEAVGIRDLCRKYRVPFVIDDDVELALETDADGVHIGQSDMALRDAREQLGPEKIIGVSARTLEEALEAERNGGGLSGRGGGVLHLHQAGCEKHQPGDAASHLPGSIHPRRGHRRHQPGESPAAEGDRHRRSGGSLRHFRGGGRPRSGCGASETGGRSIRGKGGRRKMKKVLTIAGSDSSGGAGIQADIKTITVHGMYAMTVITALTAQNTTGVSGIQEVPAEFVAKQLDAVFRDIRPDAVKIGMLSGPEVMETVAERLRFYQAEHIVVDPVMVATSGSALMKNGAAETLLKTLLPLAELITPNLPEGEALSGMKIENSGDMARAAEWIGKQTGSAVLLKGGHLKDKADDFLWIRGGGRWFVGEKLQNPNTHGTGCTLSSALACSLAAGRSLRDSVERAKAYVAGAIGAGLDLGAGSGPLNHMYALGGSGSR